MAYFRALTGGGGGSDGFKQADFTFSSGVNTIDIGESYDEAYIYGTTNGSYNNIGLAYVNKTNNKKYFVVTYNGWMNSNITLSGNTIRLDWADSITRADVSIVYK